MRTFEIDGPAHVSVECARGEVSVTTTAEGATAEVEVTPLRDDDVSRDAAAQTLVELHGGNRLVVVVPSRGGGLFGGRDASVRVDVRVPDGSAVAFRTASADVEIAGLFGEVAGKTASGDVRVLDAASVRVETASGDLRIDDVHGDARLKSASGDVTLRRAGGTVDANAVSGDLRIGSAERGGTFGAVSGDIEVGAVVAGSVDVRTVSGDVTIGVATGSRVHVDVTTVSGDLRSDVELADAPAAAGDDDGPLVDIRGRTVSGDVRIKRRTSGGVVTPEPIFRR